MTYDHWKTTEPDPHEGEEPPEQDEGEEPPEDELPPDPSDLYKARRDDAHWFKDDDIRDRELGD